MTEINPSSLPPNAANPASRRQQKPLIEVRDLRTRFHIAEGTVHAVNGISFKLNECETLAVVGESGCGKSVSMMSIMRLIAMPPGEIASGEAVYRGRDLFKLSENEMERLRGDEIAMVFQDPMTALNPVLSIERQLSEPLRTHLGLDKHAARLRAIELLEQVGIPDPARRVRSFPHEFSGGMRQRVMIAMALACNPKVLIADEPTTALDVTIQAQILELIVELQERLGTAVILITHDLGVIAETARRVIVMYAGRKVEEADCEALFETPLHPYTHGLLSSIPSLGILTGSEARRRERLTEIPGIVPALNALPPGCAFAPRCPHADAQCHTQRPSYEEKRSDHWVACWHSEKLYGGRRA